MSNRLSSQQVLEKFPNITYRQLDYWCNQGVFGEEYVKPKVVEVDNSIGRLLEKSLCVPNSMRYAA